MSKLFKDMNVLQAAKEAEQAAESHLQAGRQQQSPPPGSVSVRRKLLAAKDYFLGLAIGIILAGAVFYFMTGRLPPIKISLPAAPEAPGLVRAPAAPAPSLLKPQAVQADVRGASATKPESTAGRKADISQPKPAPIREISAKSKVKKSAASSDSGIPGRYPEASARLLTQAELAEKSAEDRMIMMNEILARHGYFFLSTKLLKYFKNQPWYNATHDDVTDLLTETEKKNMELILASTLPAADSPTAPGKTEQVPLPAPALTAEPIQKKPVPNPAAKPSPTSMDTKQDASAAIPGTYPEASTRLLTEADLAGKETSELKLMRNEIFARHFYIFQSPDLTAHFSSRPWYKALHENVHDDLSEIEKANIDLIKKLEGR